MIDADDSDWENNGALIDDWIKLIDDWVDWMMDGSSRRGWAEKNDWRRKGADGLMKVDGKMEKPWKKWKMKNIQKTHKSPFEIKFSMNQH